ncbi:MAG: SUMF1/EgtB/PvdO family nonheme iron enzyme [Desulfobulbaceae bacterium]|nr:SUMF1/EgtB/PvdO family nonheme iron enzyme [Desulfobulbaceae bacterium]
MALITHQGISAALADLRPNPATLKGRLLSLIHSYCPTDERLAEIDSIPAEDLIRQLWEVDDPAEIHQKKKNLSSLKSSINKDLKNLARQGKNPEGLIISRDNVFTISEEHKDDLLQKLGLSGALAPKDILTLMRGILDSVMQGDGRQEAASLLKEIDKTREMIARAAGMGDAPRHLALGTEIGDAAADTPVDGAASAETVTAADGGGSAASAGLAGGETAGTGTDTSAEVVGGNEVEPAALELLDNEEVELLDETEIIEQEIEITDDIASSPADGLDGGELAGTGIDTGAELPGGNEGEPAVDEWLADEDFELLDEAEVPEQEPEIADDIMAGPADGLAGGELAGTGTDTGTELPGGAEDGPTVDECLADEDFELLDEAEVPEQEPEIADDIMAGPNDGLDGAGLAGTGTDTGTELPGETEAGPAALELLDNEEVELLDETEIIEQETEIADDIEGGPNDGLDGNGLDGTGTDTGAELPGGTEDGLAALNLLDNEEVELLDEAEVQEQEPEIADDIMAGPADGLAGAGLAGTGTDTGTELHGGAEAEPAALELLDNEEVELLDETEIIEQETEIADDIASGPDDGLAGGELAGTGTDTGTELPGGAEAEPAVDEWLADEEVELLDEAEVLEQETEIIDEEETTTVGEMGATDAGQRDTARPLDLSHYIEPDEALASPPETLTESHDDYIAQILERFMPKFIKIPAGYYPTGRDQPAYNERPARKIFLQSFYIAQLPVTNDLFDFFVRETGYETDAERAGFGNVVEGRVSSRIDPDTGRIVLSINRGTSSQRTRGANWRHPAGPGTSLENKGNHPVVQVSRHDALAFAAWAGKRLPGEDEWEAAARGPAGLLFPWGNEWQGELANTEAALTGDTTPVIRHGKPSMSPFGLYDLLGNVFEWTASVHTPSRPVSNRTPPVYVLKGGCWTSKAAITMAARLLEPDTWSNIIGFRCAV